PVAIVFTQGCERGFERAAGAPKRRGLFLRDLIIERVGDGGRAAAERDHLQADIVSMTAAVRQGAIRLPVPGGNRDSSRGIELPPGARLETMTGQYILRSGVRTDFAEHRQPVRDPGIRRQREMKRIVVRQKQAEDFSASDDRDDAVADPEPIKRGVKTGAD